VDAILSLAFYDLLILVVVANGSPVIARLLFSSTFSLPVDLGFCFIDGRRILGDSKTWRGILASIVATSVFALFIGYSLVLGAMVAAAAMTGDIFSSFIKRRMGMQSSAMAPFLDQVPESLFPALLLKNTFGLDYGSVLVLVCLFVIIELSLSSLLFKWGIRRRPY